MSIVISDDILQASQLTPSEFRQAIATAVQAVVTNGRAIVTAAQAVVTSTRAIAPFGSCTGTVGLRDSAKVMHSSPH